MSTPVHNSTPAPAEHNRPSGARDARRSTPASISLALLALLLCASQAHAQTASATLTWTATGDDGRIGRATQYDARWSASKPDTTSAAAMASWWGFATPITGLPAPLVSGTQQSTVVTPAGGFPVGLAWFVMRVLDDAGNQSAWSNVAARLFSDVLVPPPITDLH